MTLTYFLIMLGCTFLMFCYNELQQSICCEFGYASFNNFKNGFSNVQNDFKIILKNFLIVAVWLILTLIMGMRASSVGTDNIHYEYFFNLIAKGQTFPSYNSSILFYSLMKLIAKFTDNYAIWTMFISAIICFFIIGTAKHSNSSWIVILLVFYYQYYFMAFNIVRQVLAIFMITYAVLLPNKSKIISIIKLFLVVCACLIHKSLLIAVPLLFFLYIYNGTFRTLFLLVATLFLCLIAFKDQVLQLIEIIYPSYVSQDFNFYPKATIINLMFALLMCILEKKFPDMVKDKGIRIIMGMVMAEFSICALYYINILDRVFVIFNIFRILIIPYLFKFISNKKLRFWSEIIFFVIIAVLISLSYIYGGVFPYVIDDFWML